MRVLCLGNNTELTDQQTCELASIDNLPCFGLLSEIDHILTVDSYCHAGYYHSSVYDIEFGRLIDIAKQFDCVIILNQTRDQYSHPDAFYKTIQLAKILELSVNVVYLCLPETTAIDYFEELITNNSSFCIFPFIELLTHNGHTTVCCRSTTPITSIAELTSFSTDSNYQLIRTKMISGEKLPEHCQVCYDLESQGIRSPRQQETIEWANRLGLKSIEDIKNIVNPVYYEVRPSNTCNLQCRTCKPDSSQLINKEYVKLQLIDQEVVHAYSDFSIINLDCVKKLYVAGGEPTAMPEFYEFVDQCINSKQTFDFTVNTNGMKLSSKFKDQLAQLPHMQFIISIDGYDNLNHYIRWPSDWNTIVNNIDYLKQHNHVVSFNITVSIYNISDLYKLISFVDQRYPGCLIHCQLAGSADDILSPLNFPNQQAVIDNLISVQNLSCYKNDPMLANFIDELLRYYRHHYHYDSIKMQKFFAFNSLLDQNRGLYLKDYIPILEKYK